MLLNFKRNFTYLSCGAHSLRCSFERSFRQPTGCLPACLHPLQLPPLQRAVQTCPTGHTAWRLHQAMRFFFRVASSAAAASSLHWPYLIIHQNLVAAVVRGAQGAIFAFDVNLRSHSASAQERPLCLSQHCTVHFIRFISCGRLPFDLQFPFPFQ